VNAISQGAIPELPAIPEQFFFRCTPAVQQCNQICFAEFLFLQYRLYFHTGLFDGKNTKTKENRYILILIYIFSRHYDSKILVSMVF